MSIGSGLWFVRRISRIYDIGLNCISARDCDVVFLLCQGIEREQFELVEDGSLSRISMSLIGMKSITEKASCGGEASETFV